MKTVYMCMSTDVIHGGHIKIINEAKKLGNLIIGVLSDDAVASYKRFPIVPFEERKILYKNISQSNAASLFLGIPKFIELNGT